MGHVFISYSHKDKAYTQQLKEALLKNGFEVWIDEHIDYGDEWPKIIQQHLDGCDAFIVVMSKNSFESDMVQNEVTRAREKKKNIFPLLLSGDAWLIFQAKQYADVRDGSLPTEKFYENLAKAVGVGLPPSAPEPVSEPVKVDALPTPKPSHRKTKAKQKRIVIITAASVIIVGLIAGGITLLNPKPAHFAPPATATFTAAPSPTLTEKPLATFTSTPTSQPAEIMEHDAQMALIPAGEFTMGSDSYGEEEKPAHKVYLDAYYIDKYKVTNALYKRCVDEKVCKPPQFLNSFLRPAYYGDTRYDDYPVMAVDWYMAKTYCEWRGARLPTEAEWEKAARGTDERIYPWGNDIDQSRANYNNNGDPNFVGDTSKVGSYPDGLSPYGVYDMAGNIWDWTADLYSDTYYASLPKLAVNPLGPTTGETRVIRGGSWNSGASSLRTTRRSWNIPSNANIYIGFRCAKNP